VAPAGPADDCPARPGHLDATNPRLLVMGRGQLAVVVAATVLGAATLASAVLAARLRSKAKAATAAAVSLGLAAVSFGLAATGTVIAWLVVADRPQLAAIAGAAGVGLVAIIGSLVFDPQNRGAEVAKDAGIALLTGAALGLVIYPVEENRFDRARAFEDARIRREHAREEVRAEREVRRDNIRFVREVVTQSDASTKPFEAWTSEGQPSLVWTSAALTWKRQTSPAPN
jgi:hypothetical protein